MPWSLLASGNKKGWEAPALTQQTNLGFYAEFFSQKSRHYTQFRFLSPDDRKVIPT
jgi:hypothetical protein